MVISKIYSTRNSNSEVYADLIYEWEDEFSKGLQVPIVSRGKLSDRLTKYFFKGVEYIGLSNLLQKIEGARKPRSFVFVFELYPRAYFSHQVFSNKIPYIIDFDLNVNLDTFYSVYRNCKLLLISSLEAFNYLKSKNCPLKIEHLPLSISDKYQLCTNPLGRREIDVIVTRSNKVFLSYLEQYSNENPDFEYVIRRWEGNQLYKNNVYFSNRRGVLGEFSNRKSYFGLLQKSKVALYATPGIDDTARRFINHVTPSLFEFVVSGCRVIARYPQNSESISFNLNSISPKVDSYDDFRATLTGYLRNQSSDYLTASKAFLDNIYTSAQVKKLLEILEDD